MEHEFTLAQARALMPELLKIADEVISVRADLAELRYDLSHGRQSPLGGLPEAKAHEARIAELLARCSAQGVEVKGWAPLLFDLPAWLEGNRVYLCWVEGEPDLEWYHPVELGFAGRRKLPGSSA